ncbi:hypothetical protein V6N13_097681 [Hibiscus sabdariffa]
MQRVGNIVSLESPTVVYLAAADSLLNNSSILEGWTKGLLPIEGVNGIYKKHPYLIQSAIDYEGESNGPQKWMTNMSDSSLKAISFGSNDISC